MSAGHAVPLATLEPDGRAVVDVDGRAVALFRVGGDVYALANECPHARNPLVDGEIVGDSLVCAYHRWRFDLATGACLAGDRPARAYAVEVRDGRVWIAADTER